MASVTIIPSGATAGVWVSTGDGKEVIGLIAQDGIGVFLAIYGDPTDSAHPVTIGDDGFPPGSAVQVPGPDGKMVSPVVLSLEGIIKAARGK